MHDKQHFFSGTYLVPGAIQQFLEFQTEDFEYIVVNRELPISFKIKNTFNSDCSAIFFLPLTTIFLKGGQSPFPPLLFFPFFDNIQSNRNNISNNNLEPATTVTKMIK